jgi:glycerol kinase
MHVTHMGSHLLAIDQGTTGTTALVLAPNGAVSARVDVDFQQHFPAPGWVEHDADEIWRTVIETATAAVAKAGLQPKDVAAVGITNQRETVVAWERSTGRLLGRAIVWQDRRTAARCEAFRAAGHSDQVRQLTGLVLDPYFSATKMQWLLENGLSARAHDLCFGTIDSFLLWRLTAGQRHATDATNASRTLLMDLEHQTWSEQMCDMFGVPMSTLPEIVANAGIIGRSKGFAAVLDGTPIAGMAGDQHAALFGQACFETGNIKCTYGTGAFIVLNAGPQRPTSRHGLLETLAWKLPTGATYALEGSCFVAGAAVQWLRDGLGIVASAAEVEALAGEVDSCDGVVFVPALAGLGAPYWDAEARGLICGITRGTSRAHIARATLEGIAFQVDALVEAMRQDTGAPIQTLRVDGGAAANNLLMQLQADLSGLKVERPLDLETTARGAAMFAGLGVGMFTSPEDAARMIQTERQFGVRMNETRRVSERRRFAQAVARARCS